MRAALPLVLVGLVVACSKKDSAPAPPPAASVTAPLTSASGRANGNGNGKGKGDGHREDRHAAAMPAKLALAVTVGGEKKTWSAADFAKVPTTQGTANDGEDRDTWSLRDVAHTLVGPNARVTAVIGDGKSTIDPNAWNDASHTPILHTTRRGTLKFRYTDAKGAWGESEVSDVTGLEISP